MCVCARNVGDLINEILSITRDGATILAQKTYGLIREIFKKRKIGSLLVILPTRLDRQNNKWALGSSQGKAFFDSTGICPIRIQRHPFTSVHHFFYDFLTWHRDLFLHHFVVLPFLLLQLHLLSHHSR